jgi:asparagine synthase (glutamine-hydrolysing)
MFTTAFPVASLRRAARGELAQTIRQYEPLDAVRPLLQKAPPERVGLINAMRYLDLKLTLGGDILVKVDRASMAVSLEVRPVYLHRDILNLAGRIPPEQLADRSHTKRVLKSALQPWLPESILRRPKQGFAMPLKVWLKDQPRQLFAAPNVESSLHEFLDLSLLEQTIRAHSAAGGDCTAMLHALYFLDRWLARWVNQDVTQNDFRVMVH